MRIAFYAPLKPPTHARPSGDRRMARLLMRALAMAGHEVVLASRFCSRDGRGDPARQARLRSRGQALARRIVDKYRAAPAGDRPRLWFTYHIYYKAPDWLGPTVCDALGLPYVVAEASHAPKRADGPWALGHAATADAIARADAIVGLNSADTDMLLPLIEDPARLVPLKPFLEARTDSSASDRDALRRQTASRFDLDLKKPWLLTVAMMRGGDKLASYEALGRTLGDLRDPAWQLLVVGDGPARASVEGALAGLGAGRVRYAGEQSPAALERLYRAADLLVWPAVREAYGMALLEAQAAGLPVVAGRVGGVPDVVRSGHTGLLVPGGDDAALAEAIAALLADPDRRAAMGRAAARTVRREHSLEGAAGVLDTVLTRLVERAGA